VRRAARIYQLKINWNMPAKTDNEQQNQAATPNPSLDVKALLEENEFFPSHLPNHGQEDTTNGHLDSSYSFTLTELLFVPVAPNQGTKELTQTTILGVYAVIPPANHLLMDTSHQWQQATSIACRWEVQRNLSDKLSSCFDQLSVKKKATNGVQPRVSIQPMHLSQ
jgi:hypothetical protein